MLSPTDEIYQKALGYVQLLKLEGKLDEQAIPELKRMYKLSQEEAEEVLNTFKNENKEAYTSQIWNNIKWAVSGLCFAIIVVVFYLFLGKEASSFFMLLAWLFGASGLGLIIYIIKLLTERLELHEVMGEKNEALPKRLHIPARISVRIACVIIICIGAFLYLEIYGKQSSDIRNWVKIDNCILKKDCISDRTTGKNSQQYYEFEVENSGNRFIWWQNQHYKAFKSAYPYPDMYFHKGDTITLWVDRKDYYYGGSESRISVYDAAKQYEEPVLDLKQKDKAAGNALTNQVWITVAVVAGGILLSAIKMGEAR